MSATLQLLGAPQWARDGLTTALPRDSSLWLIAFLTGHDEFVSREEVLEMLYPEVEPNVARNRLRQLLHRTRGLGWASGLESDAHGLRWNAPCDVRDFRHAFTEGDWARAVGVYRGALLEGCRVYDLPEFEAWLESERENLQAAWRDAALNRAAELERAGAHIEAMPLLERTLEFDPYAEEAVQAYLRCTVGSGHASLATRAYQHFRARLEQDLGLEPEPATAQLLESLLESAVALETVQPQPGQPEPGRPESGRTPPTVRVARGVRAPLTSFLGRETELLAIRSQLADPACRLLTLTGPGGMGKTRLALEVAEAQRQSFGSEVCFVPLEAASSGEAVVFAIAEAFGLGLVGADEPRRQLKEFLRDRTCLLVLDNLEQLLATTAREATLELVLEVLEETRNVKLLMTSRHRLELQAEWVVPLEGLPIPTSGTLEAARRSSGARLFVERAARVRPGFALSGANAPAVARICRLTDGLPLGLELAAAWVSALEPEEIAADLEANADLVLEAPADRPERHHSLRAAFEHSWRLLSAEERDALARLSVFQGGFERTGATRVAGASLRALLGLVNKSLLRRTIEGRFAMLEVIRQYAAEALHATPQLEATVRQAHAEYILALVEETAPRLREREQARALERLDAQHDNARAALRWALETGEAETALRLASGLHAFWDLRGHHREGHAFLEAALALPGADAGTITRAEALFGAGWLERELGEYASSAARLEGALNAWRALGDRAKEAEALHGLGLTSRETGDLQAAQALFEQAVQIQREPSEPWGLAASLNDLGITRVLRGDHAGARTHFKESLRLKEAIGDRQGAAYALASLGQVADTDAERRALTEQSLAIKRELGDRQGVANGLYNLGALDLETHDLESARARLTESLDLFWQLGRRRAIAAALASLAQVCALEGRFETSVRLIGALDALIQASGFQLQGVDQAAFDQQLEYARTSLGDAAFDQAHLHGATMRLEEAVALALKAPDNPS
jgi:predicted ATPase/DNA-binding SARP family transcriptional activator